MNFSCCGSNDCNNICRIAIVRNSQFNGRTVNIVNERIPVPVAFRSCNTFIASAPAIVICTNNAVLCVICIVLSGMAVRRALKNDNEVIPVV